MASAAVASFDLAVAADAEPVASAAAPCIAPFAHRG